MPFYLKSGFFITVEPVAVSSPPTIACVVPSRFPRVEVITMQLDELTQLQSNLFIAIDTLERHIVIQRLRIQQSEEMLAYTHWRLTRRRETRAIPPHETHPPPSRKR